jgi:hypothetical protein
MADHDVNPIIYLDAQIDPNTFDVDLRNLDEELSQFEALGILPSEPRVGISDNATSLYRRLCPGRDDYAERCDDFDSVYRGVLRTYRAAFAIYGVQPALSFADEPGEDPQRRALSNYLNRLTKEVDLRTWVTYYPSCEKPLAGHQLVFDDLAGDTSRVVPEWLSDDPHVVAHWDFRAGPEDRSANHNDGVLSGGAEVRDGLLWLPDAAARMAVADDPSLDLTEEATVYLWLRPEACLSAYAAQPLAKWSGTADANYVLYFFGDNQGQNPENKGRIGWYANAGGTWSAASGYTHLDCASGMDRWYNVLWVYDSATGGTLYVNGVALPGGHSGTLATNDQPLWLGRIAGAMDDVLILDRALSADEVHGLIGALNDGYDRSQQLRLTLAVTDTAALPATMTLALGDELASDAEMESTKEVLVDGQTIWTASALAHTYELAAVPVGEHLTGGASHTIEVRFTNGMSRREELEVDFVEDAWRRASWSVQGTGQLSHWQDTYRADDSGALGPMDPYLDDRVYAMRYVTPSEASRSRAAGDTFSYYTTYPATQPVILNNRFLNGIYASATGAEGVYIYAYGDWGPQPWDDTETYFADRSGTDAGRRGQNGYQLVLPSWEERMYDTVIYEALREGIEDSRIIATLKGAIARHPGALADEAQRYLDDVLGRPSLQYWPRYMRTDLALPIEQYADRSGDILGDLAGDPTDFGVFDRLRADMLSYIARLEGRTRAGALYLPLAIDGEQLPD